MRRSPVIALLLLAGVAFLHGWHLSTVLPDRVASHFDVEGHPNGWMSRDGFVHVYYFVIAVVTVSFASASLILPRVPDSLINLPNKSYWLAPERRASSLGWITGWSCLFGGASLLLMMAIMRQVERVNLGAATRIAGLPLVVSYVALSIGMIVAMFVKFARKPPG